MTIETKIAKNGAQMFYVDGKRTSRENAIEIATANRQGAPFTVVYFAYNTKVGNVTENTITVGNLVISVASKAHRYDMFFEVMIDNVRVAFTGGYKTDATAVKNAKVNANVIANAIVAAYINGATGVKIVAGNVEILSAAEENDVEDELIDEPEITAKTATVEAESTAVNSVDAETNDNAEEVDAAAEAEIELATENEPAETKIDKLFDAYESELGNKHLAHGYIATVYYQQGRELYWRGAARNYGTIDTAIDAINYVCRHDTDKITRTAAVFFKHSRFNEEKIYARNEFGVEYFTEYYDNAIVETDGSEEDDFADEMPALFPAEDSDDDDELIDTPELPPADDFATKLAELKAKQTAAKIVLGEKDAALLKAQEEYEKAHEAWCETNYAIDRLVREKSDELVAKFNALPITNLKIKTSDGEEFSTNQNFVGISTLYGNYTIIAKSQKSYYRCESYKTPAQVETVINQLKDAIERGDREFEFPTVEDLTIAEKIAAEKAEHEANQPAEVKALNAELAASKLQAPTMWVKITDGETGFHFGSFTRGVLSEVRVDYDAVNKYGVFYFDEPMRRYDTFAQVKTAIGQFKTAITNNAEEFTFPTIEELAKPEVDKDATADSLTRAMTIALEHYQDYCRVGNLMAATNEWSLYNICRKAMSDLLRREAA